MNNKRKIVLLMGILITIALLFPSISIAQTADIDPGCDPMDPACPIDGGITLLIAAGIGLGARKSFRNKNK